MPRAPGGFPSTGVLVIEDRVQLCEILPKAVNHRESVRVPKPVLPLPLQVVAPCIAPGVSFAVAGIAWHAAIFAHCRAQRSDGPLSS